MVDQAISGNRVLNDSPCFGPNRLSHLDRNVLGQDGARTVILLEGINDIGFSQASNSGCAAPNTPVSAEQIIAGYRHVVLRAHLHGLHVLGGTLTPIRGADTWSPAGETKREQVNAAIQDLACSTASWTSLRPCPTSAARRRWHPRTTAATTCTRTTPGTPPWRPHRPRAAAPRRR